MCRSYCVGQVIKEYLTEVDENLLQNMDNILNIPQVVEHRLEENCQIEQPLLVEVGALTI